MAKPAKKQDSTANPAPKKKRAVASYKKKRRAARANPAPTGNPPALQDLTHVIIPGFAAYGSVRVLQRIAFQLVGKRWPKWAKWAHMATGLAGFGALWGFAHRVKALAPYHDAVIMGSGVAAAQGVVGAVLSQKYTWLLNDCRPEDLRSAPAAQPVTAMQQRVAESNDEYTNSADNDEYAELEQQLGSLAGGPARSVPAPRPRANPVSSNLAMATQGQPPAVHDPDLMEELGGESLDDLYAGAFSMN